MVMATRAVALAIPSRAVVDLAVTTLGDTTRTHATITGFTFSPGAGMTPNVLTIPLPLAA